MHNGTHRDCPAAAAVSDVVAGIAIVNSQFVFAQTGKFLNPRINDLICLLASAKTTMGTVLCQ